MSVSACFGRLKREEEGPWEQAFMVTTSHGVSNVVAAFDYEGKEIKMPVWNYRLDWSHSLDGTLCFNDVT